MEQKQCIYWFILQNILAVMFQLVFSSIFVNSYTLSRICSTASWTEERGKIQTRFEAFFPAGYPLLFTKKVTVWNLSSTQKKKKKKSLREGPGSPVAQRLSPGYSLPGGEHFLTELFHSWVLLGRSWVSYSLTFL